MSQNIETIEYVPILSADGLQVTSLALREEAHVLGLLHPTVECFLLRFFEGQTEVLLRLQADKKEDRKLKVKPTFGGHVLGYEIEGERKQEDLFCSLRREAEEEVSGLDSTQVVLSPLGIARTDIHLINVFAGFVSTDISFNLQGKEGASLIWVNINNIDRFREIAAFSKSFDICFKLVRDVLLAERVAGVPLGTN